MDNKFKVVQLMDIIKKEVGNLDCRVKVHVNFKNDYFYVREIELDFGKYFDDFELVKYQKIDKLAKTISDTFKVKCNIQAYFIGAIEPQVNVSYGEDEFILYRLKVNEEEKEILDRYGKLAEKNLFFALYIKESGKTSMWGYNIYKIRVVKNIKDAADFINVLVNNVDHLEDMQEVEYTKLIKKKKQ